MTFLSRGLRLHTFVLVGVVLALLLLGGFASGSAYAAIKQHVVQPVHQVQPTSIRVGNGPLAVAMGDFNGDGKLDLVTVNEKDGTVSVLANLIDNTVSILFILLGKGNGAYSSNTVRVTGDDITAIAGTSFTCPVASVIGAERASDLTATINWGDGTPHSSGMVSGTDPYTITGTHAYITAGRYTAIIKVADSNLNSISAATATATVTMPISLTLSGSSVNATESSVCTCKRQVFTCFCRKGI